MPLKLRLDFIAAVSTLRVVEECHPIVKQDTRIFHGICVSVEASFSLRQIGPFFFPQKIPLYSELTKPIERKDKRQIAPTASSILHDNGTDVPPEILVST